ncbi:hypothetical protein C1N71_02115 [Agrococcus sp. SGAir0287]|nr:hypothetical protein C1N71_02115 [Agrococcus sp. SGAir0287]
MLDAGASLVERGGLTVGFGHLPLEEIIADAGVSRASAYRQWGSHESYVADLIAEIFARPEYRLGFSPATTDAITAGLREHAALLDTAEGRHAVLREIIRIAAERNLRDLLSSSQWHSYESLYAAAASPGDPAHAATLESTARQVEQHCIDTNAGFYQGALGMLGQRFVPPATARTVAVATHIVVSGYANRVRVDPSFVDMTIDGPAIDGGTVRWHLAAWLTYQTISAFVEDASEPAATVDRRERRD